MTTDDKALLFKITNSAGAIETAKLIWEYYQDLDRSNRTPRTILYLHLGMLAGCVMRVEEEALRAFCDDEAVVIDWLESRKEKRH
jgi:hypothetical protein